MKEQISEEELKRLWDFLNPEACRKRAEAIEIFAKEFVKTFANLNGIKFNEKNTRNTR